MAILEKGGEKETGRGNKRKVREPLLTIGICKEGANS